MPIWSWQGQRNEHHLEIPTCPRAPRRPHALRTPLRQDISTHGAAKAYPAEIHTPQQDQQQQENASGEPWSVWISGTNIVRDLKWTIYPHVHGTKAKQWWIRKERFKENIINMIDWASTGRAMESTKLNRRQWITKHTFRHLRRWHNDGEVETMTDLSKPKMQSRRRHSTCLAMQEWSDNNSMETSIRTLQDWMNKQETLRKLAEIIVERLHQWHNIAKTHRRKVRVARLVRGRQSKFFDAFDIADLVRHVSKGCFYLVAFCTVEVPI